MTSEYELTAKLIKILDGHKYICSQDLLPRLHFNRLDIYLRNCNFNHKDKNARYEPTHAKTNILGFRTGQTQTELYTYSRWLEVGNVDLKSRGVVLAV